MAGTPINLEVTRSKGYAYRALRWRDPVAGRRRKVMLGPMDAVAEPDAQRLRAYAEAFLTAVPDVDLVELLDVMKGRRLPPLASIRGSRS